MVEKKGLLLIAVLVLFLSISFVSAGFMDWITGKVSSNPTNVTINVKGVNQCKLSFVSNIGNIAPTEGLSTPVTFNVQVFDQDGFNDINQSSVFVNFTYVNNTGEVRTTPANCAFVNTIAPRSLNFTCTITMQYWDGAGNWNIAASGNDLGNKTACMNSSTTFVYNELKAMAITPAALTWPALVSGATNQQANNDPTTINNTGNFNGTIQLKGIHLYGETSTNEYIDVANFTSSYVSGSECTGNVLVNGTNVGISGSFANRGNLSAGKGQQTLYYCIPTVPPLTTQTYSTTQAGSWTVLY